MRSKVSKAPLLVFLAVFVTPVVLVPLLANDAQHLKTLARKVGLELDEQPHLRAWQGPLLPPPEPAAPVETMLDRLTDGAADLPSPDSLSAVKPQARCAALREIDPDLKPDYTEGDSGKWECVALFEAKNADDSLFLHVRGDGLLMRTFRAKLNLIAGRETQRLVDLTARAMNQFLPVDPVYVERKLHEAIGREENSTFILGYGEISIRPERGDERRYNVLMRPGLAEGQAASELDFTIPQRIGPAPAEPKDP